ncbi:MAG TPA: hypothetical protein ENO40_00115 [Desulfurella acetivorans]|nr:hypothetical protein [Desulfurella acetivorans]
MKYIACIILYIFIFIGYAWAGTIENYSNLNLLPQSSIFDSNSENINLGKIKPNENTSLGIGLSANVDKWNICSGRYSLNSLCVDSNFSQPVTQTLIGPKINFESKSSQGGFESSVSYTSSKALPIEPSSAPANINRFKMESSVNLNLTNDAQLKFIGEYKHNQVDKNPNSIINTIPKDEFGVGLKLNIGF